MKNYPNQISDFIRIRDTLAVIAEINDAGELDASSSADLGYELVRRRRIEFRGFPTDASDAELEARISQEQEKDAGDQGPLTTARELRRTLRNLGWIDEEADVTEQGLALLETEPGSYDEQALLVEGLLNIAVTDRDGNTHHPVRTLLRLLAIHASRQREGLELALAPLDDSDAEFNRIAALYDIDRDERMAALGISVAQRNNAVKIFPRLAVTAGLVLEDGGLYSLSQDGWSILGQTPTAAAGVIKRRYGRRTTSGRKVTSGTVASRKASKPPRTLSPEEQARAAERLSERTQSHQALVKRVYDLIGDDRGDVFEDEFSYDLLWIPDDAQLPVFLFEMKSVTNETDAYARVRHAVGQLHYYEHFNVRPSIGSREVQLIAAFDAEIPDPLLEFLRRQQIGAIVSTGNSPDTTGLNLKGEQLLDVLL